jgi:hypothetical protein
MKDKKAIIPEVIEIDKDLVDQFYDSVAKTGVSPSIITNSNMPLMREYSPEDEKGD